LSLGFPVPEVVYRPKRPKITLALIFSNIIIYFISSIENSFLSIGDYWLSNGAFVPSLLFDSSQLYRIFTSMFLHADLVHLFFNMYFLYIFGRAVEETLGGKRFFTLYILSGIAASIFHTAFSFLQGPMGYVIPAIGASGAISGVLGAYLIFYPGTSLLMILPIFFFPFMFWIKASYYILFWFALQVIYGLSRTGGSVAFFAHVGGFIMGIALLSIITNKERIMELRIFKNLFSYIRWTYRPRGLGKTSKIILSSLILLILFSSLYISIFPVDQGRLKTITIQYRCNSLICNDYIGLMPDNIEKQISNIPLDETRILINRLYAANLLYGKDKISISNLTSELPVKIVIGKYSTTVKIETTIDYFNGIYGNDSFISYGEGRITTYSINIFVYGDNYQIEKGDKLTYDFVLSVETSDIGSITQYTGLLSTLFTIISLLVVNLMDRKLAIVGE
jgi:membrane associated rhomboid family serine protease